MLKKHLEKQYNYVIVFRIFKGTKAIIIFSYMRSVVLFFICFFSVAVSAQNIAVNTSGNAALSTNMLEVTQSSTAAYMVALYAINNAANAAGDTGYAFKALKTGATGSNVAGYFSATGGANNPRS